MQGRAEGVWGAMGGGTKTMVGVVLPWKSMTNGGLDPIKPPKKMVTYSVSVVTCLSSCLPAIPSARHFNSFFIVVIQILWRLGWIWRSGVTQMINPQAVCLKVIIWASWYWITWFVTNQFGSLTVEVQHFCMFFLNFILLHRTLCKIKKTLDPQARHVSRSIIQHQKFCCIHPSDEVVH